ncbi:MAG TPA: hypothetical protein VFH17_02295, partial [Coriobacteriia bacterium]|nr:hypothetical protein [Coriobacteriia bacterium]
MDHMGADRRFVDPPGPGHDAPLRGDGASRQKRPALIVIAAALLLLVVAGVSVAVYTFVLDSPAATTELATPVPVEQAPVAGQEATAAEEPPPVPLSRVFTFRDIFDPLIEPAEEGAAGDGAAPTPPATDGADADQDKITLQDVVSVDGEPA